MESVGSRSVEDIVNDSKLGTGSDREETSKGGLNENNGKMSNGIVAEVVRETGLETPVDRENGRGERGEGVEDSSTSASSSTTSDDESETTSEEKAESSKAEDVEAGRQESSQDGMKMLEEKDEVQVPKHEDATDDSDIEDDLISAINYNTITSLAALKDMLQCTGEESDGVDSFFQHYFLSHVNRLPSRNQTHSPYPWARRLSECPEEDEYETEEGNHSVPRFFTSLPPSTVFTGIATRKVASHTTPSSPAHLASGQTL